MGSRRGRVRSHLQEEGIKIIFLEKEQKRSRKRGKAERKEFRVRAENEKGK